MRMFFHQRGFELAVKILLLCMVGVEAHKSSLQISESMIYVAVKYVTAPHIYPTANQLPPSSPQNREHRPVTLLEDDTGSNGEYEAGMNQPSSL